MDSNDINSGSQNQTDPTSVKHNRLTRNVETSLHRWRHANFIRMFLLPIVFALVFIVLVHLACNLRVISPFVLLAFDF